MLERAAQRFQAAGLQNVEIICCDARDHGRNGYYDVVVSNFFLNIFSEPTIKDVMGHLARMARPGARC
jgi:ubiquinone/menaquinone biosynthesis C-methylase UbiE